jgi:hypothetical protein
MKRRRPGRPRKLGVERNKAGRIVRRQSKPDRDSPESGDWYDGTYIKRTLSERAIAAAGLYSDWKQFRDTMLGPRSGRLRGDDNLHVENRGDRRAFKGLVGRSESFRKEPGLSSLGPELEDKGSHAPANKPPWKGEPKLSPLRDIEANAPLYAETGMPPARPSWMKCGDGKSRVRVSPADPQKKPSWPPAKAKRPRKGAELIKPNVRCEGHSQFLMRKNRGRNEQAGSALSPRSRGRSGFSRGAHFHFNQKEKAQ